MGKRSSSLKEVTCSVAGARDCERYAQIRIKKITREVSVKRIIYRFYFIIK